MSLSELITEIKKEQKLSNETLVTLLTEAIENEEEAMCTYKMIYKKAYGEHLTESICKAWVKSMAVTDNSDRTTGEKWCIDQTTEVGNKLQNNWNVINKWEWYAVMNAWYSDYYKTAKEFEVENEAEFFGMLAMDFFFDEDAKCKNPFNYYFTFVA